jgi:ubiquitin-conjugating enzyme E2 S
MDFFILILCDQVRPAEFDTPSEAESIIPSTSKSANISKSQPQKSAENIVSPLLSIPSTIPAVTPLKSATVTPTQPLQSSPSNTLSTTTSTTSLVSENDDQKERHLSPLGTADSNIAGTTTTNATKAVKRSAATGTGAEKRKKALKRL